MADIRKETVPVGGRAGFVVPGRLLMADIRKEMVPVGGRAGFVVPGRLLMADIRKEMVPVGGRAGFVVPGPSADGTFARRWYHWGSGWVCCLWPPADGGHS